MSYLQQSEANKQSPVQTNW